MVGAPMLNLRRTTLDAFLVEHARARGVDVRTGTAVTYLMQDGDRVTGVVTATGVIDAALVVGADGTSSTVARLVSAQEYLRTEFGRSFTWGYFSGHRAPEHTVWLGKIDDLAYLGSPTDDGLLTKVATLSRHESALALRAVLSDAGIRSTLRRPTAGRTVVLVFPEDAARARAPPASSARFTKP